MTTFVFPDGTRCKYPDRVANRLSDHEWHKVKGTWFTKDTNQCFNEVLYGSDHKAKVEAHATAQTKYEADRQPGIDQLMLLFTAPVIIIGIIIFILSNI